MTEVARVLKPGGCVILSTSNRCFPSKVVRIWLQTDDLEHVLIYASYIHYTGEFDPPEAFDLGGEKSKARQADPVYVIQARKKAHLDLSRLGATLNRLRRIVLAG